MKWGGPNATLPGKSYKISSSSQRCPRWEFCNRLVLWALACLWISSLRASSLSTLAAVPQLGSRKRLWTRLARTVLPAVQLPPRIEYAGDVIYAFDSKLIRSHFYVIAAILDFSIEQSVLQLHQYSWFLCGRARATLSPSFSRYCICASDL